MIWWGQRVKFCGTRPHSCARCPCPLRGWVMFDALAVSLAKFFCRCHRCPMDGRKEGSDRRIRRLWACLSGSESCFSGGKELKTSDFLLLNFFRALIICNHLLVITYLTCILSPIVSDWWCLKLLQIPVVFHTASKHWTIALRLINKMGNPSNGPAAVTWLKMVCLHGY